jgi:hypothetical protein
VYVLNYNPSFGLPQVTMASRHYIGSHRSTHSASSATSYDSAHTQHTASTAPTSYSDHGPVIKHFNTPPPVLDYEYIDEPLEYRNDPRSSTNTYASTTASLEEDEEDGKRATHSEHAADVISSTPAEFADFFPSTRRLLIQHDTTVDGSMNLRVDTPVVTTTGRMLKMTLFHLRMQDLRERKFSLRRYSRDSGREVCTSSKKYMRPIQSTRRQRPTLQRSLSTAIQNLGAKALRTSLRPSSSGPESDGVDDLKTFTSAQKATIPTNTIKLEFSNYAHVEVERQKTKTDKRWSFEYWGTTYYWSRAKHSTNYRLFNDLTGKTIAQITPELFSKREIEAEKSRGGWCPPCSMTISDIHASSQAKTDLADVIMATGLIALTDDSIRRLAQ